MSAAAVCCVWMATLNGQKYKETLDGDSCHWQQIRMAGYSNNASR